MAIDANCRPNCDTSNVNLSEMETAPCQTCGDSTGDPVTIDSSCEAPVFVEICNPATQPVQVISETEQLGCVVVDGTVSGRVFFVPTFDVDGNMIDNRMIMVSTDGTVTDPYLDAWEECPGAGEMSDVELNYLCVIDTVTGNSIQPIIQEILYDSAGERISTRIVDRVDGSPVALPGGTTIGVCPEEEVCVDCETIVACDTFVGAGERDIVATPIPFAEIPTVSPTYGNQAPMTAADETKLWSGATAIIPAPAIPTTGQMHVSSGAVLSTTEAISGDVDVSVQLAYLRTGPTGGRGNTGGIFLFNGDDQIATAFYPSGTPVGAEGELVLAVTVPAADLLAGNITVVSVSEICHTGNTGGWELSIFVSLLGGTLETQKFLRTICRSCDGEVVSVQDAEVDGITEYAAQGEVTICGEDRETQPEQEPCVSCQSMILCDMVPNPDEAEGIPWNVVDVVPDATDPNHVLHYHLSPAGRPSVVGIVTHTASTPLNGVCRDRYPGIDHAISNPSTRTVTLDAVAQQMDSLRVNLLDFDSFEPTRIDAPTPLPSRLGGTAYWDGPPAHATTIRPTENNGTGSLYWDNPPAEIIYQVGNTGGGNSCSSLDFQALTLSLMPRPFMRTICRDCNGEIVSTLDTELDGVTPYTPVGDVTSCTSGDEPPVVQEVLMDVVRIQDAMFDPGTAYDRVQSVTLTVLSGEVVADTTTIPAGVSLTWSVQKDQDSFITPPQFDSSAGGDFILNVTYLGA